MGKLGWVWLVACALAIGAGTASLFGRQEAVWICCYKTGDCGGGDYVCCPDDVLGQPPCDDDLIGYCVQLAQCVRNTE